MACSDYDTMLEILHRFDEGQAPLDAVICPYVADYGVGMGMSIFALGVFGSIGLALAIRTRKLGPLIITGMLSAAIVAPHVPAGAAQVMALVLLIAVALVGLFIYQRAQSSL